MSETVRVAPGAENTLCTRLQDKFSARGIAARSMDATQRFERVAKPNKTAQKVRENVNPFAGTGEFVRAGANNAKAAKTAQFNKVKAESKASENAKRRTAAYETSTPFSSGAYAAAYERAAKVRAMAYEGTLARESMERAAAAEKKAAGKIFSRAWAKSIWSAVTNPVKNEIKVENPPIAKGVVIAIVLFAVVVMMIIFSFSQISEFKKEISQLSAEKVELQEEIVKLSLEADMKGDVREIERAATEDIGMVKSNQVESRYISISGGERVELCNTETGNEPDYGIFSTVMSVFSNNWETIVDYVG